MRIVFECFLILSGIYLAMTILIMIPVVVVIAAGAAVSSSPHESCGFTVLFCGYGIVNGVRAHVIAHHVIVVIIMVITIVIVVVVVVVVVVVTALSH